MNQRTIIIDRSKWRTGMDSKFATGEGDTYLYNSSGFMCCLGFACAQIEPSAPIRDWATPEQTGLLIPGLTFEGHDEGCSYISDTRFVNEAIPINDNESTAPAEKEAALIALCKAHPGAGIMFEFVGEYDLDKRP